MSESKGSGGGKDYDVGYGKPPRRTRFEKGKSGNPYGRPRQSDRGAFKLTVNPVRDVVLEEMSRKVSLKEGGNEIQLEAIRAVVRSVTVGAIKGNSRQQKLALEYATVAQEARRAELEECIQTVEAYKARWEKIFESARVRGGPEPKQLPHPDHVNIDPLTADMVITGPTTLDEKKVWDRLKFQLRESERSLLEASAEALSKPRSRHKKEMVELHETHIQRVERVVPPGWNWREELGWEEVYTERMYAKLNLPDRHAQNGPDEGLN